MTKNTDSDRIAYPALPDPLHTSDLVRLFTPTSVELDWALQRHPIRAHAESPVDVAEGFSDLGPL